MKPFLQRVTRLLLPVKTQSRPAQAPSEGIKPSADQDRQTQPSTKAGEELSPFYSSEFIRQYYQGPNN